MKDLMYYQHREQTYLKHFFLEKYLERVAYNIGYSQPEFVYIDGFSGPWKSFDEEFEDTSFRIAINKLREVRSGLARAGKHPTIRCVFVEKDPRAFRLLETAIRDITDFEVRALHGNFESLISKILELVGNSFSLVFIDPTGWTGFGLRQINPILKHRPGEVLVNFMFDYINRFLDDTRPEISATFEELFGGPIPESTIIARPQREKTIVSLYCDRMRALGDFSYVTSTRILKPVSDRSYFHLFYGTRHIKGLLEFRGVEKKFVKEQERVRSVTKQTYRVKRTGQGELFGADSVEGPPSFQDERDAQLQSATEFVQSHLRSVRTTTYGDLLGRLLEMPLVWESDVQALIREMRESGVVVVNGLKPRQRSFKASNILVRRIR